MKASNQSHAIQAITRKEFLQVGGIGFFASLGLLTPGVNRLSHLFDQYDPRSTIKAANPADLRNNGTLLPNQQGRVLNPYVDIFDIPSYSGKRLNRHWLDWILPITGITIGKSADSFNMVWYEVGVEGFAHSGLIQPVFTITNPIVTDIPLGGTLAEVTVPYTDAHWKPSQDEPVAYRFYFATTYWVMQFVTDDGGNPWYGVKDDKWEYMYFVPAPHLRLIPAQELQQLSANVPPDKKRIEVHIPEQVMIAYEYDQPVFTARIASGAVFSNGDYSTPIGRHQIFHKRASRHMARGNLAENGYDLPGVPWNSYITEDGIAFHGTYWHNNFGRPRSHGCINLTPQAAKWVYLWANPYAAPDQEDVYKTTGTNVDVIG